MEDIYILHLNNKYKRHGELDLQQLFTPTSVLERVQALQPFIKEKELELKDVLQLSIEPNIEMGKHCHKPYD